MTEFTDFQKQKFGLNEKHCQLLRENEKSFLLQAEALSSLKKLQYEATLAGFSLQLVSAFRSFERQKIIWQSKALGQRDLLDDQGQRLDYDCLNAEQRFSAITRWSAVPGLSRHHWGTDIDIYDANVMPLAQVQLTPDEVSEDGVFAALHAWLDQRISENESFGFYRPYQFDFGVAPERWHLSYLPKAKEFIQSSEKEALLALWDSESLAFVEILLSQFDEMHKKFVRVSLQGQPQWVLDQFDL